MDAKPELKKRAVLLRKKGWSYREIQKVVPVAKSSLSLWLKHIPLMESDRARLYSKRIEFLSRGAQSQKERRKREIAAIVATAKTEVQLPISTEARRLFGAALYWAEGSKTKNFEITNSDPVLIAFMIDWFEEMFTVSRLNFKAHLNIYPQQDENDIKRFWSDVTGIPLQNFGKTFVKPPNKGFKKNTLYYGTIKVRVPKGTDMRHRIVGWIQAALQDLNLQIESTQLRWSRLRNTERPPVNLQSAHSSAGRAALS